MDIRGYLPTSLNEWPGKISAVVWVAGCNFRCPFCDNRDLVLHPKRLPYFSEARILNDLKRRRKWLDSVCNTGGEPTLQPDLEDFLGKIKKIGLLVMIETNGSRPEVVSKLLNNQMVDRITMDIKGPLEDYQEIIGVQIKNLKLKIKNSIQLIVDSGVDFEFRTTVVPTIHTKESLLKLANQLRNLIHQSPITNHQSPIWVLQQFVPQNCIDHSFEKMKPFSEEEMKEILGAVKKYLPETKLRGV